MGFYKATFMNQFTSAFKEFQSVEKRDLEILLGSFLSGKNKKTMQKINFRALRETCKKLCNAGCYSTVIKFVYGIFLCGKTYNLSDLKIELDRIKIREDIKLPDLCSDFFLYTQKNSIFYHLGEYKDYDFDSIDLYRGEAENYFDLKGYDEPYGMTKDISEYMLRRLFNLNVNIAEISRQDIDYIAAESIRIKTLEIEKENEDIDRENKKLEEHEKQGSMKNPRIVPKKETEFKKRLEVAGLLLDILRVAAAKQNEDMVYYIQTEYLWPIMKAVPWIQQDDPEVQLMGIILEAYLRCIFDFEVSRNRNIYSLIEPDNSYNETNFLDEMVNNKPGMLSGPATEFGKRNRQLGRLMSEVIYPAKEILKKVLPPDLYSFMMALVPYFLFFSGYHDEASEFLIKNYNQISSEDRQRFFLQITMVKCIMSCQNLQRANILYGFYASELNRQDLVKNEILSVSCEIIQYIKDVKEYIYLGHDYTIRTQRAWHDVVFGDGSIMKNVELAEKYQAQNKFLPEPLFSKLVSYVESFCHPAGILLDLLGLPNEDNYDKLPDALPDELISRGNGIISYTGECMAFYQNLKQLKLRKSVDIFLQRHISELMDEALEETIKELKTIREEITKQKTVLNEENIENVLKNFDKVVVELARKLESKYIGRENVELYIDGLQTDFIKTYRLDVAGNNLISKLPDEERKECNNFLVTSEIVYRMLSRRSDRDKLDFSPALISLTKALELVLNIVFQKLYITQSNIDKGSWDYYLNKYDGNKKESIELGPCINLLKDGMLIQVIGGGYGKYELSWKRKFIEGRSRFSAMQGEKAINFNKLSEFKGLKLIIQPKPRKPAIKAAFSDDSEFNRMLLIKGLEYVKDNYRNNVAHKDGISPDAVKDCRRILIQSENLLWILLYIINF